MLQRQQLPYCRCCATTTRSRTSTSMQEAEPCRRPAIRARMMPCATMTSSSSSHGCQREHPFDDDKQGRRSVENPAGFPPSVWGDFFLQYNNPTTPLQQRLMEERAYELKQEVAKMISRSSTCSLYQSVDLIYALEHLCLDSLFQEEINSVLEQISDADVSDCDLRTVARWFYLLRSHGHRVSPDLSSTHQIWGRRSTPITQC